MAKKVKTDVNEAYNSFNNLYAEGAIVNLGENPRYPQKVKTGRPSIDYLTDGGFPKGRLVLIAGEPSAGKCLAKGTEVLMYNGEYKKVENIKVGNLLMGVDSSPRMVCNTSNGIDKLYKVKQENGADYVVNSTHTLTVVKKSRYNQFNTVTSTNNLSDDIEYINMVNDNDELNNINVEDLIKEIQNSLEAFRKDYYGVKRPSIIYDKKDLKIKPYLLGFVLTYITDKKLKVDKNDIQLLEQLANCCVDNKFFLNFYYKKNFNVVDIVSEVSKEKLFLNVFNSSYFVSENYIPLKYLTSDFHDRFELLAGILDANGKLHNENFFEVTQKNEQFVKDIKQLAESCGFICSEISKKRKGFFKKTYQYTLTITGNLSLIPNKAKLKQGKHVEVKDSDYFSEIKDIEYIGKGEYYGFEVDGDAMFMLRGQTITHNSSLTIQISESLGDKILYIDTEATLTTDYIEALGANPKNFSHSIPSTTEQMCDIIRSNIPNFDVIIVDSINNSASNEQMKKTAGEKTMANRALVLSNQLPILIGLANQYNTTLIILSQIRENINKMNKYDSDTVIPGGKSLHHNSSLTLELFKSTKKQEDISKSEVNLGSSTKEVTGNAIRIKCTKNKVGTVNRQIKMDFVYGQGYVIENDVIAVAIELGIIEKAGSWMKYNGESIVQGQDNLREYFKNNDDVYQEIKETVNFELTKIIGK